MGVQHQNHPNEGRVGYDRQTPYLCDTPYTPADGPGASWQNAEAAVTCPLCRAQPTFGLSETAHALVAIA